MKYTTRTLAAALAALLACASLAACAGDSTPADTTAPPSDTTAAPAVTEPVTESPYDEAGFLKDDLPADLSFGGKEISFLVWEDVENPEFEVEAINGEIVNDAIYNRNRTVEERLDVKLVFDETPGNYANQKAFLSRAQNITLSGQPLDIMAAYSLTATSLVANGITRNLADLKYLDFSKPWWPDKLVEEATIGNNIYFCSGDLSTNNLHKMHAVFFDKETTAAHGIDTDDLYREALEGKWTVDRMIELTAEVYTDVNNNGMEDASDSYGMVLCDNYFDVFFYGSGLRTVERDSTGTPVISPSFGSEKTAALVDKIGGYFANNPGAYFVTNFTEGRFMMNRCAMMIITRVDVASKNLRSVEGLEYGILPVPKHDEAQEGYIGCLAFPCTLYTVSKSSADAEMAGAVLECMGSEGYRQLTPALFETTMKIKYASDELAAEVYDIIRASVSFDLGRMFASSLNNFTYTTFRNSCNANNGTFTSLYTSTKPMMDKLLAKLVRDIQ